MNEFARQERALDYLERKQLRKRIDRLTRVVYGLGGAFALVAGFLVGVVR